MTTTLSSSVACAISAINRGRHRTTSLRTTSSSLTAEVAELHARAIDQGARRIAHGHGHTHARDEGKGAHLKAINGKLIAAETSLETLRDREIGSSQSARQKAFMSNFFAPAEAMCTTVHR